MSSDLKTTRATRELRMGRVSYGIHSHFYDLDAYHMGVQAAVALGHSPERVLKTLIAEVDGKPECVVIPFDSEASMKKQAAAFSSRDCGVSRPRISMFPKIADHALRTAP